MDRITVQWNGEDGLKWSAELGIKNGAPCFMTVGYESNGNDYNAIKFDVKTTGADWERALCIHTGIGSSGSCNHDALLRDAGNHCFDRFLYGTAVEL